jgi:hypothetical protein
MGWMISAGKLEGGESELGSGLVQVVSTQCMAGARWRFTSAADRATSGKTGSTPPCQAQRVWEGVLSNLVGNE